MFSHFNTLLFWHAHGGIGVAEKWSWLAPYMPGIAGGRWEVLMLEALMPRMISGARARIDLMQPNVRSKVGDRGGGGPCGPLNTEGLHEVWLSLTNSVPRPPCDGSPWGNSLLLIHVGSTKNRNVGSIIRSSHASDFQQCETTLIWSLERSWWLQQDGPDPSSFCCVINSDSSWLRHKKHSAQFAPPSRNTTPDIISVQFDLSWISENANLQMHI